jgi:hypothetical protein
VSRVQAVGKASVGTTGTTVTIGSSDGWATPTAGNLLVFVGNSDATLTLSGAGTVTNGPQIVDGNGAYVWWKFATGTETAPTVTPVNATDTAFACLEYDLITAFDVQNSNTVSGVSGSVITSTSVTTTNDPDLVLGVAALHAFHGTHGTSPTWTAGLTNIINIDSGVVAGRTTNTVKTFIGELLPASPAGVKAVQCSWTNPYDDRQALIIAFKATAGAVAPDVGGYVPFYVWPGAAPWINATPGMPIAQDPLATDDGFTPSTVTLTEAVASWSAVPVQADPQPVQLTLAPATATWSGVVLTPTPGQVSLTLTPATAAWSAVPVVATPNVPLTPATASWTAVPVVATPAVGITPATAAWTAVAVTPTPGQVALTLTPASAAWSAVPLTVVSQVSLTPATATWTAVAVTPVPQPVTKTLTPATATWTAQPVALTTPGALSIVPATASWSAVAVTPVPQPITKTLTPATAVWSAVPVVATPVVTITPAVAAWSARPLTPTPGVVSLNLAPAGSTWTAVALTLHPASVVALSPVGAVWTAVAVSATGAEVPGSARGIASQVGTVQDATVAASGVANVTTARINATANRAGRVDGQDVL